MNAKQNVQLPSFFAITALVMPLLLAGNLQAQNHSVKPLVVGSEEDYPPFSIGKSEEAAGGFTLELWKAVAAEQKFSYTFRVEPFRKILEDFKAGQIDVLINLAQSDERRAFADFSVPHVIVPGAIFVRRNESRIRSEEDFAGKEIIVQNADLAHDYAVSRGWQRQLVQVDNVAEGLKLLASGKHDAFAVKKENSQLLAKMNEGLATAKASGTQDALCEKWFGVFEVRQVTFRDLLTYLGPLAIVVQILVEVSQVRQRARLDALFGLPPGQTVRSLEKFIAGVPPDDRPGVVERCQRCAREGADFDMRARQLPAKPFTIAALRTAIHEVSMRCWTKKSQRLMNARKTEYG